MRGLCGWFADRPRDDKDTATRQMLAANPTPLDKPTSKTSPRGSLAVFGGAKHATLVEDDDFLLAFVGHPRLLGDARGDGGPLVLLRALRERGKAALTGVGGDFALAVWDGRRQRGLLAVDRMGTHPLVYAPLGGTLAFASTLDVLGGHPGVTRRLSQQGLFDYLYYHVSPGPKTVFEGLERIPAGHCIEFGAQGASVPTPYWTMVYEEQPDRPFELLKGEFVAALESAVRESAQGSAAVGAFLSGGTDSSTVAGMLGRVSDRAPQTFSIGFDAEGYDEMAYARIAARHFRCDQHEYYVTPADVVAAVPKIAAAYDQPFGNASAIPTYYCAQFARQHGIERLLAGDGGDELFGGNERYAKQHLLGHYDRVPLALRRALLEPLLLGVPGTDRLPLVRKARSYIEQARPGMPQRYASYNLLERLGHERVFMAEFLDAVDPGHPRRLLAEAHAPFAKASLVDQMQAIDLRFILADGDLPKVTRMCELAGVDVAFPMLDERVVEFSRHLSADLKLRGTTLRWFFKQALADFLPGEIIAKQKHGFGLPVGTWLVGHKPLFELAMDSIGRLRERRIVQPRFIDDLSGTLLHEHPAYYGTMVWVLMMLSLWLESRKL